MRYTSSLSRSGSSSVAAVIMCMSLFGISSDGRSEPVKEVVVEVEGAEPIIAPSTKRVAADSTLAGGTHVLDGLECLNCVFENVVLTYAGGNFKLVNPQFKGKVSIEFKGAALNGIALFDKLNLSVTGQSPKFDPKANPRVPVAATLTNTDLKSHSLGK
jgi:hypothetical protein